jgi:hypothetical protein
MNVTKRISLPLSLAICVLGLMALSQIASATHPRPKGATPFRASLVPAYKQCTGVGNRTHGQPLAYPSCAPPVQTSSALTVGTPDANGAAVNSIGSVEFSVKGTSPEDILIDGSISDARCKAGVSPSVCSSANTADGPDYSGALQSNQLIRLSDHYNGPNLNEAATVIDFPLPFSWSCATTADMSQGGLCTVTTSFNAIITGLVKDAQRGVVEYQQEQISDAGVDGDISTTADNTLFEVQGNFIP